LEKYTKENATGTVDKEIEIDDDDDEEELIDE
jgi:hypothetical protein